MAEYGKRIVKVFFGLFLCAFGTMLAVQANIGLAPWDAFCAGLAGKTGISFGRMMVFIGIGVLLIDLLLKEKIGIGTIINTLSIGTMVDILQSFGFVPQLQNLVGGVGLFLLGQVFVALGNVFYMSPGLGCGPRDSLFVGLGKRVPKVPIGVVRGGIEACVLLLGWFLGAPIGLGTVISVLGGSTIFQLVFRFMDFNARGVIHESIFASAKGFMGQKVV